MEANNLEIEARNLKVSVLPTVFRLVTLLFLMDTIFILPILALFFWGNLISGAATGIVVATIIFLHTTKFLLLAYMLLRLGADLLGRVYLVRNHHLFIDSGITSREERIYNLEELQEFDIKQTSIGKLFNYGDIRLRLRNGPATDMVTLQNIKLPQAYVNVLESCMRHTTA